MWEAVPFLCGGECVCKKFHRTDKLDSIGGFQGWGKIKGDASDEFCGWWKVREASLWVFCSLLHV